jgi:hypothetical protein
MARKIAGPSGLHGSSLHVTRLDSCERGQGSLNLEGGWDEQATDPAEYLLNVSMKVMKGFNR